MPHPASAARGVYLITPDETDTARLLERTRPLLAAGAAWLQYRNKAVDAAGRHEQAQAMQALCAAAGVPLIVNDDAALAAAVGAAGVHLGEDDGDIAAARALLGAHAIIGASCYDRIELAQRAVAAGASYVAFGAFFPSRSKATTRRAHPQLLREAAALGVPRVAIGGLTADNGAPLVDAGADLLAVISGVYAADDPVAALRGYQACFPLR
jgi:thiamine-phosphate pyrophosphorylase